MKKFVGILTLIIIILIAGATGFYFLAYKPKVDKIAEMEKSLEQMVSEVAKKESEISKLKNIVNNRDTAIDDLNGKIDILEREIERLKLSVGDIKDQSEEERKNLEKDKEDPENSRNKLLTSIEKSELQQRILMEELLKMQQEIERLKGFNKELITLFDKEIKAGDITVTRIGNRLIIEISNNRLFSIGSDNINSEGERVIKKISGVLKGIEGNFIQISGYTDNTPISGGKYSNWDLASSRALKVLKILESDGIDPKLMYSASFGEHQPKESNDTEEGRSTNRRIDIQILPIPSTLEEALLFESQTGISSQDEESEKESN